MGEKTDNEPKIQTVGKKRNRRPDDRKNAKQKSKMVDKKGKADDGQKETDHG